MPGDAVATLARDTMTNSSLTLRPYSAADEDAAIELWRRTWQKHYPHLNFTERVPWWRERWRKELVPVARVVVAEDDGALIGFVTVDPRDDVSRSDRGRARTLGLGRRAGAARRGQAPFARGLELLVNKDNARAIRFYEKHGFVYAGEDKNPVSGKPVNRMAWRPKRRQRRTVPNSGDRLSIARAYGSSPS